jgi:DNA replicative helicase MCM subunit Mcm2 (Cdc46/Mcm family)
MGGVAQEALQNNHNAGGSGGATQDFPPLLLRRYELRILPLGRRGSLLPFVGQHLAKTARVTANIPKGVSLRHLRSKSLGRLVTIKGMVVRHRRRQLHHRRGLAIYGSFCFALFLLLPCFPI